MSLASIVDRHGLALVLGSSSSGLMMTLVAWWRSTGSHVKFRNIQNSKEIFENFKFTGLSNFSFLELDVLNAPVDEEA